MHLYGKATDWRAGYALVCCMAEIFGVKELQILWQMHLYGEAAAMRSYVMPLRERKTLCQSYLWLFPFPLPLPWPLPAPLPKSLADPFSEP